MSEIYTVEDIYGYCKDNELRMLSNYTGDFWTYYMTNSERFDRQFMRRYRSFFPYIQNGKDTLENVSRDFIYDVQAHLVSNAKRYSELFRVNNILDNDAYSLTNNVDYTETLEESTGKDITFNKGSQTDTEDLERVKGSETDTEDLERVKGSETDTEDLERVKGSETDTEDLERVKGSETDTTENSTSAYNGSGYTPVDKSEVTNGQRTDTEDNSRTFGQRTDTEDNSRTYGAREDTTGEIGTRESTIHKVGNMGVQTVDDMLTKHVELWSMFNLYDYIFSEIANDLLRGVI